MRRSLSVRVAAGLLVLLGFAAPAAGQGTDDLVRVMDTFTGLWQRGDASGLLRLTATGGLELEVYGEDMGSVRGRRAAAALRHVFAAHRTVSIRPTDPSRVTGADNRAFVELVWVARPAGAPVSERSTVFIAFVQESRAWKVSQIRIMR